MIRPLSATYIEALLRTPPAELSLLRLEEGFKLDTPAMLAHYPFGISVSGGFERYRQYGLQNETHAAILLPRLAAERLKKRPAKIEAPESCPASDLMVEIATLYPSVVLAANAKISALPPEVLRAAFRSAAASRRRLNEEKSEMTFPTPAAAEPPASATEEWEPTVPGTLADPVDSHESLEPLPIPATPAPPVAETPAAVQRDVPGTTQPAPPVHADHAATILDMLEEVRSGAGRHNIPDTRVLPTKPREREGTITPTPENGHARAS
jgi:hypothetical protein